MRDLRLAAKIGEYGLKEATILDDENGILHDINIEYAQDEEGAIYRRLNYTMITTTNMKKVITTTNETASQLLYKIALAMNGMVIGPGVQFDKSMLLLRDGETWDNVLPTDKGVE